MVSPRSFRRSLTALWHGAGSGLVDTVYPKRCAGCDARGGWVCPLCFDDLPLFAPPWCARCGIPERFSPCRCADLPPAIGTCRAVGPYAGWLRAAIIALKYEDEPARAAHLGGLLAPVLEPFGRDVVIGAVPLHARRERERGYNQSLLVARKAARALALPVLPLLRRTRATTRQVGLDAAGRRANVVGAFEADARVIARGGVAHVVLVDDVMTTGATLEVCAAALLASGVGRVDVVVLARDL